jgi:hypothetical protein
MFNKREREEKRKKRDEYRIWRQEENEFWKWLYKQEQKDYDAAVSRMRARYKAELKKVPSKFSDGSLP